MYMNRCRLNSIKIDAKDLRQLTGVDDNVYLNSTFYGICT